jgi:hypothetical protein
MTERNSAPLSSIRCWTIGIFSCFKVSGIIF